MPIATFPAEEQQDYQASRPPPTRDSPPRWGTISSERCAAGRTDPDRLSLASEHMGKESQ